MKEILLTISFDLNGIYCDSLGERIRESFDKVRVLCSPENDDFSNQIRVYDIVEYGIRYMLEKNRVIHFKVADPIELEGWVGMTWIKCG